MGNMSIKPKIKQGDEIIVIAGKDKGKRGTVKQVKHGSDKRGNTRVWLVVEGINIVKKHVKPNPNKNEEGGILPRESKLDISNVKLFNASADKGERVGLRYLEDGRKVRYFKSTSEVVDTDV